MKINMVLAIVLVMATIGSHAVHGANVLPKGARVTPKKLKAGYIFTADERRFDASIDNDDHKALQEIWENPHDKAKYLKFIQDSSLSEALARTQKAAEKSLLCDALAFNACLGNVRSAQFLLKQGEDPTFTKECLTQPEAVYARECVGVAFRQEMSTLVEQHQKILVMIEAHTAKKKAANRKKNAQRRTAKKAKDAAETTAREAMLDDVLNEFEKQQAHQTIPSAHSDAAVLDEKKEAKE